MGPVEIGIKAIERGWVPDSWTRRAVRRLCRKRLTESARDCANGVMESSREQLRTGPIACVPEVANQQHYEVPAAFFQRVLGPNLKYSCCYFSNAGTTLADAEQEALRQTCQRAEIADGQRILELGCGWGSLSLWMASKFPNSQIVAVSNSSSQRQFIERQRTVRGLKNLQIVTDDMNDFVPDSPAFDRVVSVEMFEHMWNYERLLARIAEWLGPDGKLFVHIFCHAKFAYPFLTDGATNWMGQHFFSGGIMPSQNMFEHFRRDLLVEQQFHWNGGHYRQTLEQWLVNMDDQRDEIMTIFTKVYGEREAIVWFNRWRMFFIACAELFGFRDGDEWFVSHYLLRRAS